MSVLHSIHRGEIFGSTMLRSWGTEACEVSPVQRKTFPTESRASDQLSSPNLSPRLVNISARSLFYISGGDTSPTLSD